MLDARRTRRWFHVAAVSAVVAFALVSGESAAQAPTKVTADVLVLHAKTAEDSAPVDPRVAKMPQLTRPPFSAFKSFKVLDQKALGLEKGRPSSLALANGQTLQLTWQDMTPDKRFHATAAIVNAAGQSVLKTLEVKAAPDEPFFVAGQSYDGGTLVIGITFKK